MARKIFRPVEVCFIQERDFGAQVGDAVNRVQGTLLGGADASVALPMYR
jgi:hypothetical protein